MPQVPFGYCQCGCGGTAPIAAFTSSKYGALKDQPRKYISGHNKSRGFRKYLVTDQDGRQCSGCGEYKSWERFNRTQKGLGGRSSRCKTCVHDVDRLRNFGITSEDYRLLLKLADEKCDICRLSPEDVVVHPGRNLAVDHFHGCDRGHEPRKACPACIRGILCIACNQMIGYVEKTASKELLFRFSDYLSRRPLI